MNTQHIDPQIINAPYTPLRIVPMYEIFAVKLGDREVDGSKIFFQSAPGKKMLKSFYFQDPQLILSFPRIAEDIVKIT
jgi:hypothetical protein